MYLPYTSHCETKTKLNIITTETRRILRLCSSKDLAWPHLETLRHNLINSGYPQEHVTITITREAARYTPTPNPHAHPTQPLTTPTCPPPTSPPLPTQPTHPAPSDTDPKFILKIPYVNEALTRKIRTTTAKSSIPIRVVTTSGRTVKSEVKSALVRKVAPPPTCNCRLHQAELPCNMRNVVYKATCRHCSQDYIGATARPLAKRVDEHEASQRLGNNRSTLGKHLVTTHPSAVTGVKYSRDFEKFFENYDFRVLERGRDSLDTFLRENLAIQRERPGLNQNQTNGFMF